MLTDQLQKLGLTEGEAKVYEALVSLGPSTVGPVVKRSGVAYSNVYDVLARLQEKGLVTFITREKTKIFSAVPPTRIAEYLDRREEEIREGKALLAQILPALSNIGARDTQRVDAEIFVGTKGLRTAYDILYADVVRGSEALYFYAHDPGHTEGAFAFYRQEWPRMKRLGITARGIEQKTYQKTAFAKSIPSLLKERYVDFPVPGTIDIIGNRIMLVVWGERPISILIHSEQVAKNFRAYFESVWKIAKK